LQAVARVEDYYVGRFAAMANPCEVLTDTGNPEEAQTALRIAQEEARRIEFKFSRYRDDNIIHRINHSQGRPVPVDEETAALLDYAATCYAMSDGMFDITSGALRRVWKFDGSSHVPSHVAVREVLRKIGWEKVRWADATLQMPAGMEIDLGGIGKEYAVDRAAALVASSIGCSFLLNFGGDLHASAPRQGGRPWIVGVDDPDRLGVAALYRIELPYGGLATSGDARRFVLWNGKRLGHILNPKTGWPVEDAPRAVTVLSRTCLEAGTLSTLAYLQGPRAHEFLTEQGVQFWII
jgi:thiamine biosynthesis lipoprotein